ncbi:MAG: nucleoside-triphosphatase [Candidatus Omnitrophota bacterium]
MKTNVYIVSGGIDTGKTREMEAIYHRLNHRLKRGDGFLSKKVFSEAGDFVGYELVRLRSGERVSLAYNVAVRPPDWDEIYRCGVFSFSGKAIDYAERVIDEILGSGMEPVFIDEIGPLELNGKGFCGCLTRVLSMGREVYLAVRQQCVQEVVRQFDIRDYEILTVR